MIQKVFGVRDSKANAFLQPFFSNAIGSAIRAFSDVVNDNVPNNQIAKHPEDYMLYELGSFDDNTGKLESLSVIKLLGTGKDFVVAVRAPSVPVASSDLLKEVVGNGK